MGSAPKSPGQGHAPTGWYRISGPVTGRLQVTHVPHVQWPACTVLQEQPPPFPSTPLQALAMFLHLLKTCDKEQTLVSLTGNWLLRAFPWGRWGTRVGGVEHSWHGQGSSHPLPQGGPHNPAATSLTLFPRGSEDRASDQTLWLSQIILLGMRWGGPVALVCVGMWGRPWPTADWEPPGQGKEGAGLRA